MIAPAAHTSKGLAKAFVSSAGGKGPETFRGALRPLFLSLREEPARLPRKRVPESRSSRRTLRAKTGRLHHSLYHAGQGNKDYKLLC